jgi:glycosyltransferase involved in cell wall biosynthesis
MCRISVCIATYNGEKFIVSQLRSILGQLSAQDEIIISDDGSQDRTMEIIKEFKG